MTERPTYLRFAAVAGLLAAVGILVVWAAVGSSATTAGSICNASPVHYVPYTNSPPSLRKTPWVAASPTTSLLVGHLFYWRSTAWGRRGTRTAPFRIYRGGRAPGAGIHMKILWALRAGSAHRLILEGRKIGAPGQFSESLAGGREFPSVVKVPTAGCWRLTLTAGAHRGTLTVVAVPR